MKDEKKPKSKALTDEALEKVNGGALMLVKTDKKGADSRMNESVKEDNTLQQSINPVYDVPTGPLGKAK